MMKFNWPLNALTLVVSPDDWPKRWAIGGLDETELWNLEKILKRALTSEQYKYLVLYYRYGKSKKAIQQELDLTKGKMKTLVANAEDNLRFRRSVVKNSLDRPDGYDAGAILSDCQQNLNALERKVHDWQRDNGILRNTAQITIVTEDEMLHLWQDTVAELLARASVWQSQIIKLQTVKEMRFAGEKLWFNDPLEYSWNIKTIYDLGLSQKTIHLLRHEGINTVSVLNERFNTLKLGQKTRQEIRNQLYARGFAHF
jgi:hypothetical protein